MSGHSTHYALDIGAHALKLVRFLPGKQPQILGTALHKYANPSAAKSLAKELRSFLAAEDPSKAKPIFVSLSVAQTFVRYIRLPEISESKIRRIILFEAEQEIPFPIDEVIWDYATLPVLTNARERMTVLCAARKDMASELITTLDQMKFSVRRLTANPVALFHLYHRLGYDRRKILSVDMGAQTTNILILNNGNFWSRSLSLGGNKLCELIQSKKGITLSQAEEEMRRITLGEVSKADEKELKEIAEKFFFDLINEVNRTISFYFTQAGQIKFDQAFTTGGLALIEGLAGFFELNLGIATRRLDGDSSFGVADLANGFKKDWSLYSVAFGLASGVARKVPASIHMIPGEVRADKEADRQRLRYLGWGAILLLFLSFCVANVFLERTTKRDVLEFEKARLEYYAENVEKERGLEAEAEKLKGRLEVIRSEIVKKPFALNVFKEIESRTPRSIWYVSLNFELGEKPLLKLQGETFGSLSDINHFADQLEQSALFKKVEVVSAGIVEEPKLRSSAGIDQGIAAKEQAPALVSETRKAARMFTLIIELEL